MHQERARYKETWEALAETEESAYRHISGQSTFSEMADSAARHLKWLRETVSIHPADTVLEIGCGVGRLGNVVAPLCKEWIGCDVSSNMLAIASRNITQQNARFVELSGYDLAPVPDASVDLVYCAVVFMHLSEWDRFNYISEAHRILRPTGRLFVDNVNLCTDEGWAIFEQHRKVPPLERQAHITMASTPDELTTYLKRAAFAEVECRSFRTWVQAWGRKL